MPLLCVRGARGRSGGSGPVQVLAPLFPRVPRGACCGLSCSGVHSLCLLVRRSMRSVRFAGSVRLLVARSCGVGALSVGATEPSARGHNSPRAPPPGREESPPPPSAPGWPWRRDPRGGSACQAHRHVHARRASWPSPPRLARNLCKPRHARLQAGDAPPPEGFLSAKTARLAHRSPAGAPGRPAAPPLGRRPSGSATPMSKPWTGTQEGSKV